MELSKNAHKESARGPKRSWTPGFFAFLASRLIDNCRLQDGEADDELTLQPEPAAHTGEAAHPQFNAKQSGGFRDVANHTTAEALPTCWPLVEQVFHFFARKVCSCPVITIQN